MNKGIAMSHFPETKDICDWIEDHPDRAFEIAKKVWDEYRYGDRHGHGELDSVTNTIHCDIDAIFGITRHECRGSRQEKIENAVIDQMIADGWGVDEVGIDVEDLGGREADKERQCAALEYYRSVGSHLTGV